MQRYFKQRPNYAIVQKPRSNAPPKYRFVQCVAIKWAPDSGCFKERILMQKIIKSFY